MEDACATQGLQGRLPLQAGLGRWVRKLQQDAINRAENARLRWSSQLELAVNAAKGARERLHWVGKAGKPREDVDSPALLEVSI